MYVQSSHYTYILITTQLKAVKHKHRVVPGEEPQYGTLHYS